MGVNGRAVWVENVLLLVVKQCEIFMAVMLVETWNIVNIHLSRLDLLITTGRQER